MMMTTTMIERRKLYMLSSERWTGRKDDLSEGSEGRDCCKRMSARRQICQTGEHRQKGTVHVYFNLFLSVCACSCCAVSFAVSCWLFSVACLQCCRP